MLAEFVFRDQFAGQRPLPPDGQNQLGHSYLRGVSGQQIFLGTRIGTGQDVSRKQGRQDVTQYRLRHTGSAGQLCQTGLSLAAKKIADDLQGCPDTRKPVCTACA